MLTTTDSRQSGKSLIKQIKIAIWDAERLRKETKVQIKITSLLAKSTTEKLPGGYWKLANASHPPSGIPDQKTVGAGLRVQLQCRC
jgi:hypothetical protein